MNKYKIPPQEFVQIMHKLNEDWDFTNWESSPEWRIFNAGRLYELESTSIKLRAASRDIDRI